jgi:hypothetical protein
MRLLFGGAETIPVRAVTKPPNNALKPTSRIEAIFSVLMRSNVGSIFIRVRLAGLAPELGCQVACDSKLPLPNPDSL